MKEPIPRRVVYGGQEWRVFRSYVHWLYSGPGHNQYWPGMSDSRPCVIIECRDCEYAFRWHGRFPDEVDEDTSEIYGEVQHAGEGDVRPNGYWYSDEFTVVWG